MKRFMHVTMSLLVMMMALAACKKGDPPVPPTTLELSPSGKIVFSAEAPTTEHRSITVTSSGSWEVTCPADWAGVSISGNIFTVMADPNPTTEDRTATITVKAQAKGAQAVAKTITVEQLKLGAAHIASSIDELTLAYDQTTATDIAVTTNQSAWDFSLSEGASSWLTVTKGEGKITVSASANTDAARTATITLRAGEGTSAATATISVAQAAAPAPSISAAQTTLTLAYDQTTATDIAVTTNQSAWDFSLSEGASSWLTVTKGEGKITVSASANTDAARTATITLTAGEGTSAATATISVTQAAAPAPSISAAQTTLTLAYDQTTATDIAVTTNQSAWDFSLSEGASSWLTVTKGEGKITVSATANSDAARTATITLTAGEGATASSAAVVVTQNSDPSRIETVNISAGSFLMGSPEGDPYFDVEETPQRTIPMSAFRMSKYEITNAQYAHFLNSNKEHITIEIVGSFTRAKMTVDGEARVVAMHRPDDESGINRSLSNRYNAATQTWAPDAGYENYPASMVTWWGAKAFAQWVGGKLPSESQWEYACRAGTTTPWYWGPDENEASDYEIWQQAQVGSKRPNPWGLYDMGGSVAEWCLDDFTRGAYFHPATLDWVRIIPGATVKARRGGSTVARYRSAYRTYAEADYIHNDTGFRVIFTN